MHHWRPFYWHDVILIPARMSRYNHYMVWDGDTYPFPNFSDVVVEVWKWKSNLSHTLLGVSLLIHAGINVNVNKLFPCGSNERNDNDVVKWKHFPSCSPFVRRIHRWPVRGEFTAQRPVTRSCDLFVDLHLKKTVEYKIGRLVIWEAITPVMTSL